MIYTTKANESFDAEILRQELVRAIGPTGWYINTAGKQVEFVGDFDPSAVIEAHFNNGIAREKAKQPTYADLRRAEYPSVGDQLDAIWKGGAEAEAMKQVVMAVKARYPKP